MSQWNYLKLEIGILDSLMRQLNGFEDFSIFIFGKILLKFVIVFQNFWIFLSFSEFNDHYWPTKLFKSCRWINWHNSKNKKQFSTFSFGNGNSYEKKNLTKTRENWQSIRNVIVYLELNLTKAEMKVNKVLMKFQINGNKKYQNVFFFVRFLRFNNQNEIPDWKFSRKFAIDCQTKFWRH